MQMVWGLDYTPARLLLRALQAACCRGFLRCAVAWSLILPFVISYLTLNAVLADTDFPIPAAARHNHFPEVCRRRCWRHCGGVRE